MFFMIVSLIWQVRFDIEIDRRRQPEPRRAYKEEGVIVSTI